MTYLLIIGIIILFVFGKIAILYLRSYKIGQENIICFTGAPGTNKTNLTVSLAMKKYKQNYKQWRWQKFKSKLLRREFDLHCPELISNIPIRLQYKTLFKKEKWAQKLKLNHLLLIRYVPENSVFIFDDYGSVADQYSWDNALIQVKHSEMVRFLRHYGMEWYMFVNDQSIESIVKNLRLRIGVNLVLYNLQKYMFRFWKVKLVEVILNAPPELQAEEKYIFGRYPKYKNKYYDTHCYSINYKPNEFKKEHWQDFKTDEIIIIPKNQSIQKYYKENGKLPEKWKEIINETKNL